MSVNIADNIGTDILTDILHRYDQCITEINCIVTNPPKSRESIIWFASVMFELVLLCLALPCLQHSHCANTMLHYEYLTIWFEL
ncbi:hypothetical protein Hanom_Chr06g00499531 [Helianthus anomalus]